MQKPQVFPIGNSLHREIQQWLDQLYRTEAVLMQGSSLQQGRQLFVTPERAAQYLAPLEQFARQQTGEANLITANCWATEGAPGSYHTLHHHQNYQGRRIAYSMITYIDIPEGCSDAWGPDGNTVFVLAGAVEEIVPTAGSAVIFPSDTLHGVYPHREGVRRCFNIDFRYK